MCRNIKMLFNFEPPVTEDEIRAASLQFVRKISGFSKPSKANEAAFEAAIEEVTSASTRLLRSLETNAPPRNREEEAAKAKARGAARFGDVNGCEWRRDGERVYATFFQLRRWPSASPYHEMTSSSFAADDAGPADVCETPAGARSRPCFRVMSGKYSNAAKGPHISKNTQSPIETASQL